MKIRELLEHIDSFAPFSLAEEWDNPGLLVGSLNAEAGKIAVCLDAVSSAVLEAEKHECNVLVCHHPVIFRGVKSITDSSEQGRTILEAVRRNIHIIAAHTNWDKAPGGVNDTLAALLGLKDTQPLDELGVCGKITPAMFRPAFLEHVKQSWGLTHIDYYGQPAKISRVALCGGSGSEFWRAAKDLRADIYLTSDMKYHELSDAVNEGLAVGLVNHGEMERASLPELARKISLGGFETELLDVKALPEPMRL
ncbi:MAG: Nif3-like dinuclear metal center hexameric protein [Synergistaceae bacterium]|nr:Nif3-like dinuclear metal center hexameric protein [Synergistaceae bacterium]